jgi:hypothetical protein
MNVPHSPNPNPSWYGESVGHYEGSDTLVVDTIAISTKTFIDSYRTPHTDQLHVVERYKLIDGGKTMEVFISVDDPGAFTTPWSAVQRFRRVPREWSEDICAENNFDFLQYEVVPLPAVRQPGFLNRSAARERNGELHVPRGRYHVEITAGRGPAGRISRDRRG